MSDADDLRNEALADGAYRDYIDDFKETFPAKPLVSSLMDTELLEEHRKYNEEFGVRAPSDEPPFIGPDTSIGNPNTPNPHEGTVIVGLDGPTAAQLPPDSILDFSGAIDGGGVKDSMVDPENKPMMSLVPRALILGCAKALTYGAKKYAANNWRRGMRWGEPADAILRHFTAWLEGEDTDPESGLSHLAHVAANLGFLMHMETNYEYALMDDRPQTRQFTEDG